MSETTSVNINDHSSEKISPDKNISNINVNARETETRTGGPDAATLSNNLNKMMDLDESQKDIGSVENSEHKDFEYASEEAREQGASCGSTNRNQTEASGSENEQQENSHENQEDETPQMVRTAAYLELMDTGSRDSDSVLNAREESQETPQEGNMKMNIEIDDTSCQSVAGSTLIYSHTSPENDSTSSGQNSGTEEQAEANDKESVTEYEDADSKEREHKDDSNSSEVRQNSDEGPSQSSVIERSKSDSENEDGDVVMESPKSDSSMEKDEKKKSNIGSDLNSCNSESDPSSNSHAKKDEENLASVRGAEGFKEEMKSGKETNDDGGDLQEHKRNQSDANLKPSDLLPPRLARIKRQWSEFDTKMYRDGYPGKEDDPDLTMNLDFYQGRIKCRPDGDYIDNIHNLWWNDYRLLEVHHGYIQWLFPIRESGMNWQAQELQLHEAEKIRADERAMQRVKLSYEMMLNFYGIHLISSETGEVERAQNYRKRFDHLNFSMHNYLRITRILKCLGELGLERFKAPFLRFMLHEAIYTEKLNRTLESCYNYWIGTVRDDEERHSIKEYAKQLCLQAGEVESKSDRKFVCCLD